jgi:hypothetical protein
VAEEIQVPAQLRPPDQSIGPQHSEKYAFRAFIKLNSKKSFAYTTRLDPMRNRDANAHQTEWQDGNHASVAPAFTYIKGGIFPIPAVKDFDTIALLLVFATPGVTDTKQLHRYCQPLTFAP